MILVPYIIRALVIQTSAVDSVAFRTEITVFEEVRVEISIEVSSSLGDHEQLQKVVIRCLYIYVFVCLYV